MTTSDNIAAIKKAAKEAAAAIGVTLHSDMRIFVEHAVEYALLAEARKAEAMRQEIAEKDARIAALEAGQTWRDMDSAPLDGKHCILLVPEPSGFIYSVQGTYRSGSWDAVHRSDVQPLAWMPNVLAGPDRIEEFRAAIRARTLLNGGSDAQG